MNLGPEPIILERTLPWIRGLLKTEPEERIFAHHYEYCRISPAANVIVMLFGLALPNKAITLLELIGSIKDLFGVKNDTHPQMQALVALYPGFWPEFPMPYTSIPESCRINRIKTLRKEFSFEDSDYERPSNKGLVEIQQGVLLDNIHAKYPCWEEMRFLINRESSIDEKLKDFRAVLERHKFEGSHGGSSTHRFKIESELKAVMALNYKHLCQTAAKTERELRALGIKEGMGFHPSEWRCKISQGYKTMQKVTEPYYEAAMQKEVQSFVKYLNSLI